MTVKSFEQFSREGWGKNPMHAGQRYTPTNEELGIGALARIATALESLARDAELIHHELKELNTTLDPGRKAEREKDRREEAEWEASLPVRHEYRRRLDGFLKALGGLTYAERQKAAFVGYFCRTGWDWMPTQDPALLPWAELGNTKRRREACQKVAALLAAKPKESPNEQP